ncbi:hypothetical protein ACIQF6_18955 [Kitasatospora sp. NPDC092948]|uniref:hypothetical protein n=1 Tax=Kitasatospora sp. NPDC092948 TaxID=3364088 RepID=UPI0038056786
MIRPFSALRDVEYERLYARADALFELTDAALSRTGRRGPRPSRRWRPSTGAGTERCTRPWTGAGASPRAHSGLDTLTDRGEAGTLHVENRDPAYERGAVLPADRWAPLTPAAARLLTAEPDTPADLLAQLGRLPGSFTMEKALIAPAGRTLLPAIADGPRFVPSHEGFKLSL